MRLGQNRWGSVPALLLCGILASGCSRPLPPDKPNAAPSAFFDCCQNEKFGVRSPQEIMVHSRPTNVSSGEVGFLKYRAWTSCKTDQEARKFLDATFAALRHKAEEKGCQCQGTEPQATGLSLKYRCGHNDGALVGRCVLSDTQDAGKTGGAYFAELKLTEVVGEQ
jgi:hypothetical protein